MPMRLKLWQTVQGLIQKQYELMVSGTHLLDINANKKVFTKSQDFDSIYGSSYHVNKFNVENGIYKTEQNVDGLIFIQHSSEQLK